MITQCPECSTRFKVSDEQLAVHHGMVRCGRCDAVFNAEEHLFNDEPNPQLSLPIHVHEEHPVFAEQKIEMPAALTENTKPSISAVWAEHETFVEHTLSPEIPVEDMPKPVVRKRGWGWIAGSVFFVMVLLAQIAYFFRVDIAAQLPGLKPVLTGYCSLLRCSIPLPRKSDLMSIESSDLEADPLQGNLITLSALLRNRANYVQAYPNLELSLTDSQDKVLARHIFIPGNYLGNGEDEKSGLAANRELNIKLRLDTTDLKPTGYKLFLYYL